MQFVTAILIVAATTSPQEPLDYETAYNKAIEGDKPLLVLVTAEWCPPCQVMKKNVLPKMLAKKSFADYHFATVDVDEQPKIANQLIKDRGIPQLLLYEQKPDGQWRLRYLSGAQSVTVVETFLNGAAAERTAQANSETDNRLTSNE